MPFPTLNPFVLKIFPVTPFNSKISTTVPSYPYDSNRSQGEGDGEKFMFTLYPHSIPRCQHIKVNGTQCGSPALRRNRLCYFHKTWQGSRIALGANRARRNRAVFDLPLLEDANSIQLALMQVMRLILSGQIDGKTAGLLLYALQTASSNLARTNFEPTIKTRVVIDPRTVDQTPLGEDPWNREDYREQETNDKTVAAAPAAAEEKIPQIQAAAETLKKNQPVVQSKRPCAKTRFPARPAPQHCKKGPERQRTGVSALQGLAQVAGEFA
jgi:hypothetical protein